MTIYMKGQLNYSKPSCCHFHDITLLSSTWTMESLSANFTGCNISLSIFNFISSEEPNDSAVVIITNSHIGRLIVGRNMNVTIESSKAIELDMDTSVITMMQASIHMKHSLFMGNTVSNEPSILNATTNCHVLVENCTFFQNSGYHGVLYLSDSSTISINNSVFNKNVAVYSGSPGAVTIRQNSVASITRSVFTENQAYEGAAVAAIHSSTMSISNCTFLQNRACVGGSAFVGYNSLMTIGGSLFRANMATNASITNSFNKEHLPNYYDTVETPRLMKKSLESFESSGQDERNMRSPEKIQLPGVENIYCAGGAIILTQSQVNITGSSFMGNSAQSSGGAICALFTSHLTMAKSKLVENSAQVQGGAIFANNNCSSHIESTSLYNNTAFEAGAIIVMRNSSITIYNNTFMANSAKQQIGAVGVIIGSTGAIWNCSFLRNHAGQHTGAFLLQTFSHGTIMDSTFDNNTAAAYHSAIFVKYQCNLLVEDTLFRNNRNIQCTCSVNYFSSGTFSNTTFINNQASSTGM